MALFGQEFTFRGLPWGSTREQVVEKLGKPDDNSSGKDVYGRDFYTLTYYVLNNGYISELTIDFRNGGLERAFYIINRYPLGNLNTTQLKVAHLDLFRQLIDKYGIYNELFIDAIDGNHQYWIWHLNNFQSL